MKKLISCILLLSSFLTPAMAQTNIYEKLATYTRMIELLNEDSLKSVYVDKTMTLVKNKMSDQNLSDSILRTMSFVILTNKYKNSQEFKQRVGDLRPYIDQYMTRSDIASLVKNLDYAKNKKLGIDFGCNISDEEKEQIGNDINNIVVKYMNGEELPEPKTVKCPKDFWEAFMQRYNYVLKPYIIETIDDVRNAVCDRKSHLDAVGKAKKYILANYNEILLSNYVGKYQLIEIRVMNDIALGDAAKKAVDVVKAIQADGNRFAEKCVESHIAYVKELSLYYNSEDGTIKTVWERKSAASSAPQMEYSGNCLSIQVKAGKLYDQLKGIDLSKYDGLKITGTLNTADVRTIRALYGAEMFIDPTLRDCLLLLDLSDAKFITDKSAYFNENATLNGLRMTQTTTTTVTRYEDNWRWGAPKVYRESNTFDFRTMTKKEWERFKSVIGTEYKDRYFVEAPDGYYVYYFVSNKYFPTAMMRGCKSLQYIVLPKKCKEFDQDAVRGCGNLKVVAYNKKTDVIFRNHDITMISKMYDKTFVY